MLKLLMTLLLFSLEREHSNVSSMVVGKLKNSNQRTPQLQTRLGANGYDGSADRIDILFETPAFEATSEKHGVKGIGLTLEQCYGKLGRWLSSNKDKKKELKTEQKCCICCGRPISDQNHKTLRYLGKESEKCCVHLKAGHDGCSNLGSGGGAKMTVSGTTWDSKFALQRSANTGTRSTSGLALESGSSRVAGTVQRFEMPKRDTQSEKKPAREFPDGACLCQLCCDQFCPSSVYDCCGECIICSFGGMLWAVDRGCRACCGLLWKGLEVCFRPCCG